MPSKGDPHPGSGAGHDAAVGTVLGAVNELLPGIGERAAQAESDRRLPDSTVKELTDTGVMRLLKPKAFGGYEADPVAFYEAVLSIAEHCGSTAWVTGVVGVHNWQLALFESKLQHEIWDENPDAWVSSSYMPGGKLTAVPGGFELTGRWSFSSGSDHCQWAILGALQMNEDGPPTTYNVVIPRTDYVVEDVWHTVGLRGTGSNDIVIDGAFVPSHRALTKTQVYSNDAPGRESNTAALYGMPFATMFPSVITAPVVGMAQGLLDIAIDYQSKRVSRAHGKMLDADPYSVAALGAAASTIDAAVVNCSATSPESTKPWQGVGFRRWTSVRPRAGTRCWAPFGVCLPSTTSSIEPALSSSAIPTRCSASGVTPMRPNTTP